MNAGATMISAALSASHSPVPMPDRKAILHALEALYTPSQIVEVRAFHKGRKRTDAGYFDSEHREQLAEEAARLNAAGAAVYLTLNPIDPQLIGRYHNRIEQFANATATDANVTERRWLLVDFDPVRPKDTSATDEQLEMAHAASRECYQFLKSQGWPDPLAGPSGNGYHLLYPVALPNDTASRDLVKGTLEGLAAKFDDDSVTIDRAVFNAARITKCYGTVANKGDHTEIAPHRLSRIVSAPARKTCVTPAQLKALHVPSVALAARSNSITFPTFDVIDFLSRLGIGYSQDMHEGSERFKLEHCPFNPDHGQGEAAVFRAPDGRLGFKCQHNSCADKTWQDVRATVDGPKETRLPHVSQPAQVGQHRGDDDRDVSVKLICGADLTPECFRWVWEDWLALGKLHILAGVPGTGKTTIALAIAATVTIGGRLPDGSRCAVGNVLIWSGEDDPTDTLLPRLLAMGADARRVHFVGDARVNGESVPFDPAKHLQGLLVAATMVGDVRLLIVDPIVNVVLGDSHKNGEVRRALQPIVEMAVRLDAAALGISHFSKGTAGRDPVERITGSGAFGALPRVVMAAAKEQEGPGRRLVRTKSNIGPDGGGFTYSLEQVELPRFAGVFASRVLWGEALEGTAKELLAVVEVEQDGEETSAADMVTNWLHDLLIEERDKHANGAVDGREIFKLARANGFAERTVYRARDRLQLTIKTTGFGKDKISRWSLPDDNPANPANPASILTSQRDGKTGRNGGIDGNDGGDGGAFDGGEDAQDAQDAQVKTVGTFDGGGHLRGAGDQPAADDGVPI